PDLNDTLAELLDVMDNLERAVLALDPSAAASPVSQGVRQIHKQLGVILGSHDVRAFTSLGTPFDIHRHEAIHRTPSADVPKDHVIEAMKQGYFRGPDLFRPAQVVISSGPPVAAPSDFEDARPATQGSRLAAGSRLAPSTRLAGASRVASSSRLASGVRRSGDASSGDARTARRPSTGVGPTIASTRREESGQRAPAAPITVASNSLVSTFAAPTTAAQKAAGGPAAPARARSGVNVPDWVRRPPTSDERAVYFVGQASGHKSQDEGRARAAEKVLPELIQTIPALLSEGPLKNAYTLFAQSVAHRRVDGMWDRLVERRPEVARWVGDFYWHQVDSDLSGRAFDTAVLLLVPTKELLALVESHAEEQRGAGLAFIDPGPFIQCINPEPMPGVLVTDVTTGGIGQKGGISCGDVITGIGPREMPDVSSARRLLNLASRGRRPFEVKFLRDFSKEQKAFCAPINLGKGGPHG
ncbi:MAG: hypothetical protein ACJA1R_000626, partial [Flavobacteriales bacterium]